MPSSPSFLACSLFILAFANNIGGGCSDNELSLAEARQEVNDFLSCVLQRAGMDTIMLKLLGTSVGTLFGEKCTAGIQADPDPTLKSMELDVDVVSGRLKNALIDCFTDGNDNRQCCSDKGVPNECIYLCGGDEQYFGVVKLEKDMKQYGSSPLVDNCKDHNLEIYECHFNNRKTSKSNKLMGKLVELEKMKREKQLMTMKEEGNGTGIVTLASDSVGCGITSSACTGAGIGCAAGAFFGPFGALVAGVCGIVTGVGCFTANIAQDCI